MTTLREAALAHQRDLESGIPDRLAGVLIEGVGEETVLPGPTPEDAPRFMTLRVDTKELEAQAHERLDQLRALLGVIGPESKVFALLKSGENESPHIMVGRAKRNDVMIVDATVSSVHAFVQQRGDRLFLTDSHSKNGTWVNRNRVGPRQECPLSSGDCVRLGTRVFYFVAGDRWALLLESFSETHLLAEEE